MRAGPAVGVPAAAERSRAGLTGVILHIGHDARYPDKACTGACRTARVTRSTSPAGNSADHALAKWFNTAFGRETFQDQKG
ncbi:hypothetical protein ACWDZ4_29275 [Streptomyces sp. NPDC003016]